MIEKDRKTLSGSSKTVPIHWDTNLRTLKLPNSQIQERLDTLIKTWEDFKSDLSNFDEIRVNRYMFEHVPELLTNGSIIKMELFVFSDSSGKMICATAYIRLTYKQEDKISRHAVLHWRLN